VEGDSSGAVSVIMSAMNDPTPAAVHDGLAVYDLGAGPPTLVVPSPHGFVLTSSASGPLSAATLKASPRVVTFDPPGAFRSARPAALTVQEMTDCCEEALAALDIASPVDVVAHSHATMCALALALDRPALVRRLVLVGAVTGGAAVTRADRGLPFSISPFDPTFWKFAWWGSRLRLGGNLAVHKRFVQLIQSVSYADPASAPIVVIDPGDRAKPPPARDRWQQAVRNVDLRPRLRSIAASTLVCAGRFDPQTPLQANRRVAAALPHARIAVFEHSGHYPFAEEREQFAAELSAFLAERS
jgi:3-oxoadipate enol-lactonase